MGFYNEKILPHLINCTCSSAKILPFREKIVPKAFGEVLEVGIGSGLNLSLYNPKTVTKLWGLEPSLGMRKQAEKRASPVPVQWLDLGGENIPLADASIDSIVITFTLCTIADWHSALKQMHRVLKPNGRLFFCEHGLSPDTKVQRYQNGLNPVWKIFSGGCHLNRPAIQNIILGGFEIAWEESAYLPNSPKFATYISYGEAYKKA